ncbi:MAG: adenylate kinase-like kinase [Candidatus Doudnabacteria bacterium Gr01-1014_77]|uniref:Adenylate kinase n=1 Tax=Candidatus Doudnabacteria bacterium Gr01-1014_77 TaxID=2017133 RepID=A0A554JB81_9BACT|nr:MAG: adenylate kinase-like kinase [Candidatus Doudnabacteria bacterium Gr01-1014_77]
MDKEVFIFIGRSGCGKGTQKDLLIKHLESIGMSVLSLYVGDFLRQFVNSGSFVANKYKVAMSRGELAPDFTAITAWGEALMKDYKEGQSIIFDGSPRTLPETYSLEGAINFLGFVNPVVIHLDVSSNWARERLVGRGRADDTEEDINRRLSWFDTTVLSALNYFKSKPNFKYVQINGEQTIPKVAEDIMNALPYLKQAPVANKMKTLQYVDTKGSLDTSIQQNGQLETQNFIRNKNP